MENFRNHLKFIIDVQKKLIENEAKGFRLSELERIELNRLLDGIASDIWSDDERWERNLDSKFKRTIGNYGLKAVIEIYNQIDWNEHGAFHRIKRVIILLYIHSFDALIAHKCLQFRLIILFSIRKCLCGENLNWNTN